MGGLNHRGSGSGGKIRGEKRVTDDRRKLYGRRIVKIGNKLEGK